MIAIFAFETGRIVSWTNRHGTPVPRPLASHFLVQTPNGEQALCPIGIFTEPAH